MKVAIFGTIMLVMSAIFFNGCGQGPNGKVPKSKQSLDTDVTSSPEYNFKSFTGTVWKTKVKMALADLKRYTGRHDTSILPPRSYDPKHTEYMPAVDMRMISELPVGTRLRIQRLMKDHGTAGFLWITATLEDGKAVYLSDHLLAKNRFIREGSSDSKEWGVDPDMLEKAE